VRITFFAVLFLITLVGACPAQESAVQFGGDLDSGRHLIREMAWSHQGNILAVIAENGIWIVPRGESPAILVEGREGEEFICPSFAYGDKELFFTLANNKNMGKPGQFIIESVNIETGIRTTVKDNAMDGKWSGDGRYFLYFNEIMYGVWALSVYDKVSSSRTVKVITDELGGYWHYNVPYCISPDTSHIVINIEEDKPNNPVNLYSIYLDTGDRKPVTSFSEGYTDSPMYSPDGAWLLFTHTIFSADTADPKKYATKLMVYNKENGECRTILQKDGSFQGMKPVWTPDGKRIWYILFSEHDGRGLTDIYSIDFDPSVFENPAKAESEQSRKITLLGNYPNPFNVSSKIVFSSVTCTDVRLEIYNILGQRIQVLFTGPLPSGNHTVSWDGRDDGGRMVESGQYFVKLNAEGINMSHKILYLK
jgi:Tol biopolymer transport system component